MTGPPPAPRGHESTPRGRSRPRVWAVASVVVAAVHLAALYWPRITVEGPVTWTDKLVHPLLFLVPMLVWSLWWGRWRAVAGVLVAHAVLSEVVQHSLLPNRSGDPWDTAADLLGVGVGVLVAAALLRRRVRTVVGALPRDAATAGSDRW